MLAPFLLERLRLSILCALDIHVQSRLQILVAPMVAACSHVTTASQKRPQFEQVVVHVITYGLTEPVPWRHSSRDALAS